jgi:quaternary ammonium compound-resistance protein SugE
MAWVYLFVAAAFEILWAICLKQSDGFSKWKWSIATIAGMLISFTFLAAAIRTIPVGTGYAVWTGIGAVGTAFIGILILSEPVSFGRVFFLFMILSGVVGLKYTSA